MLTVCCNAVLVTVRHTGSQGSNCSHKNQQALKIPSLLQAALSFQSARYILIGKGFVQEKKKSNLQKINWEKPTDNYIFSFCHMVPVLTISLKAMISVLFCSNSSLSTSVINSPLYSSDTLVIADWSYTTVFMCKAKWFKGEQKISPHSTSLSGRNSKGNIMFPSVGKFFMPQRMKNDR